eukprot:CAMPEP_0119019190 /NCGR_PEP_ID=MMETSP1176-20130426/21176_1 /TAXON_ID=265551 /ORGANISM="Synedropsis recta cf, Strain CCMP1620" /LENGTH=37 /DNA_ID= /DNA_START= /DNA_END= /DNA_ORIENTATION=
MIRLNSAALATLTLAAKSALRVLVAPKKLPTRAEPAT